MSEKEFREELAAITRATLRHIERERAAGSGELLAQSVVKAAASLARGTGAGGSGAGATLRRNASGVWIRMPAPSPVLTSQPQAPRC